jgi:pimeloyl-ACP methyl ester carboxylesterase
VNEPGEQPGERPELVSYDEFAMFHENAAEFGIPYDRPPRVRRESVALDDGRQLSALVWGDAEPELVFLHGGAQNAHTWDTVALALARPLIAIDLPGHGHSDQARHSSLNVGENSRDVASVITKLAPNARAIVGMSLGGMTTLALADAAPELVRAIVLVDVTPGVNQEKSSTIGAFIAGPESFADLDEILARTIEFNPTRSESSLRRGVLHNALQRPDGSWVWRYARFRETQAGAFPEFGALWDTVEHIDVPLMLVRGMLPQSVVDDDDEAELVRRRPNARVEHVAAAGHSVQGDDPLALAALIRDFVDDTQQRG